jgi:PAS domain S-box-containing protein
VVTASTSEEIAVARIKQGAADYILKDRLARLGAAVERALEEKKLREEKARSETAFREIQARTQAILDSALDCIVSMDHRGRILEFNPAAEKTFGRARAEVIGKDMAEIIIPPGLRARHRRGLARYLETREAAVLGKPLEMTAVRASGDEFPVELSIVHVPGSEPPAFTGFIRDITERKRRERKDRENLERIRALHEIDLAITSTLDLRTVLKVLLEKIGVFLPVADAGTVRLFDWVTGKLEPLACRGIDEAEWKAQERREGGGRSHRVVESKAPAIVLNVHTDPDSYKPDVLRKRGLVSYLGVPLIAYDEVLGVLSLYTRQEHEFTGEEIEFVQTLAGLAAIAIHNARLFARVDLSRKELAVTLGVDSGNDGGNCPEAHGSHRRRRRFDPGQELEDRDLSVGRLSRLP